MYFKLIFSTLCLILVQYVSSDEVLVQLNIKRPINIVSDKYISFSIDPKILLDNINGTNSISTDSMAQQLSPSYLKISGNSFFMLTLALSNEEKVPEPHRNIPKEIWKNFNDWIRSVGWKPVIPLPYAPGKWDPKDTLRILNISNALDVNDCIWQLGLDFNATGASKYASDLKTLQLMVDVFKKSSRNWGVIGADLSAGSNPEETRLYTELVKNTVKAIGWMQPSEYLSFELQNNAIYDRDMALRTILNYNKPAWLSLPANIIKNKTLENCSALCVAEGLQWAQILGDAAQIGFQVVFKPLDRIDISEPGLSFYISLLFKKTMGEKVFDTMILNGDRFTSHVYSHCTKNKPGALTIMAVNMASNRMRILTSMAAKNTGFEIWQYLLTINDGTVLFNGETIESNATFDPFIKIKRSNRPVTLILPPKSVGFWILPQIDLKECKNVEILENMYNSKEDVRHKKEIKTSTDVLLQQLIMENYIPDNNQIRERNKRHTVVKKDSKYLNNQLDTIENELFSDDIYPGEVVRQKRFVLKAKRPSFVQNIVDIGTSLERDIKEKLRNPFQERFLRNSEILKPKARRYRRQVGNIFRRGILKDSVANFKDIPNVFPKIPKFGKFAETPEKKLFESKENVNLPTGDVFVKFSKGPSADYEYVDFDDEPADQIKRNQKQGIYDDQDEETYQNIPNSFHDSYDIKKIIPRKDAKNFGEIWEVISKPDLQNDQIKLEALPRDHNIGYVVRELEPTWNQNYQQLQKTHQQLQNYYMESAESDENLERDTDRNGKTSNYDLELIKTAMYNPYEDDDEDDFFFESKPLRLERLGLKRRRHHPRLKFRRQRSVSEKRKGFVGNKMNLEDKRFFLKNKYKKAHEKLQFKRRQPRSIRSNSIPKEFELESLYYDRLVPYLPLQTYEKSFNPEDIESDPKSVEIKITAHPDVFQNLEIDEIKESYDSAEKGIFNDPLLDTAAIVITPKPFNDTDESEETIIVKSKNAIGSNSSPGKPPKFIQMMSKSVSNFMEMVNHHITGWWNTWV